MKMWEQWARDVRHELAKAGAEFLGGLATDQDPTTGPGGWCAPADAVREEPVIVTEPTEKAQYVESQERRERERVQSFEGRAGSAQVPVLNEQGFASDSWQRLRGMWMNGEFVYYDPTAQLLQTRDVDSVRAFVPDPVIGDVDEQEPDWHRHAKVAAIGAAVIHHPSDAGRRIEVRGVWTEDWNDDPIMYYVALDGTVSGSAQREDVVHFAPIVEWSDELCEEIGEDVYRRLVDRDWDLTSIDKVAIVDAVLTKRTEKVP
jgi:hypothetical protein